MNLLISWMITNLSLFCKGEVCILCQSENDAANPLFVQVTQISLNCAPFSKSFDASALWLWGNNTCHFPTAVTVHDLSNLEGSYF